MLCKRASRWTRSTTYIWITRFQTQNMRLLVHRLFLGNNSICAIPRWGKSAERNVGQRLSSICPNWSTLVSNTDGGGRGRGDHTVRVVDEVVVTGVLFNVEWDTLHCTHCGKNRHTRWTGWDLLGWPLHNASPYLSNRKIQWYRYSRNQLIKESSRN